jgi:hypothetical protein
MDSAACCVCGSYISSPWSKKAIFLEDEKWKYYKDQEFLLMDAKELKYFHRHKLTWTTFHRLSGCPPVHVE